MMLFSLMRFCQCVLPDRHLRCLFFSRVITVIHILAESITYKAASQKQRENKRSIAKLHFLANKSIDYVHWTKLNCTILPGSFLGFLPASNYSLGKKIKIKKILKYQNTKYFKIFTFFSTSISAVRPGVKEQGSPFQSHAVIELKALMQQKRIGLRFLHRGHTPTWISFSVQHHFFYVTLHCVSDAFTRYLGGFCNKNMDDCWIKWKFSTILLDKKMKNPWHKTFSDSFLLHIK